MFGPHRGMLAAVCILGAALLIGGMAPLGSALNWFSGEFSTKKTLINTLCRISGSLILLGVLLPMFWLLSPYVRVWLLVAASVFLFTGVIVGLTGRAK